MQCVTANIDIEIQERGTFDQSYQWLSDGEAVNITGYTAEMEIRQRITDATEILKLQTAESAWEADGATGIYMDDAATGTFRVYIKDDDTDGLCPYHKNISGVYDLFLKNTDGETVYKQYGTCTIKAAVTRD